MASYGDTEVLSEYAGVPVLMRRHQDWQHGWIPSNLRVVSPEQIVGSDGLSRFRRDWTYLVARQDQVDHLESFGYRDVRAIGLPVCYLRIAEQEKKPGSLLAVPHHSATRTTSSLASHEKFAKRLLGLKGEFSEVSVLLNGMDFDTPVRACYEHHGLTVVRGALESDSSSLKRVVAQFCASEAVTSNHLGSAIPYAAQCGAKVSVIEGCFEVDQNYLWSNVLYRNCLPAARVVMTWESDWRAVSELAFLQLDPTESLPAVEWSSRELGLEHRLSPSAVTEVFENGEQSRSVQLALFARHLGILGNAVPVVARTLLRRALTLPLQVRKRVRKSLRKSQGLSLIRMASRRHQLRNTFSWALLKASRLKARPFHARHAATAFFVRPKSTDVENVLQHFVRDELGPLADFVSGCSLVLDVGAYCGYSSLRLRQLAPQALIVAVEPRWDHVSLLDRNVGDLLDFVVVHGALWTEGTQVTLAEASEGAWSTTTLSSEWGAATLERFVAPVVTWPDLENRFSGHGKRVFMKMDIEGAEANLFESYGAEMIAFCDVLAVEVHDWIPGVQERVFSRLSELSQVSQFDTFNAGEFTVIVRQ